MSRGDAELLLIALAAMLSPTTLSFSVLALVLGERPLRTGAWFYLGALSAILAIGVVAALLRGMRPESVERLRAKAELADLPRSAHA